jgi:multisubunit Na+/H+ antiporter MnhC subunit
MASLEGGRKAKLTGRAPVRSAQLVIAIVLALGVGLGVALAWVWIGSKIQGTGANSVNGSTAAVIFVGIVLTYLALLLVIGWFQTIGGGAERRPPVRYPWNRSMRAERYQPGTRRLNPIEGAFVFTAIVVSGAFLVWLFALAGSPLPAPGGESW